MKRILSGIQTTGRMTIGNYLGAVKNWVDMQNNYDCLLFAADLHSLTVFQNIENLHQNTLDILAFYLACGIDPKKSAIFIQSHVPAHCELSWILSCFTYLGELSRMTQFKHKSKKNASNINAGLLTYPVLMSADILLYQADLVPVGQDQKQHLEITRNIAERFNSKFGKTFNIPEPYTPKATAKIMSLQDPTLKMSKSDKNLNAIIFMDETADEIMKKLKRTVTDSENLVKFDENRPGISNLINIYASITQKSITEIENEFQDSGYGKFKTAVAEVVIDKLSQVQSQFLKFRDDKAYLTEIYRSGAKKASEIANKTLSEVKNKLGLVQN